MTKKEKTDLRINAKKIITFLKANNYNEEEIDSDYISFFKSACSSVDICKEEIVLIGEEGDWLHLPVNFYALLGALIHHRELACDYKIYKQQL